MGNFLKNYGLGFLLAVVYLPRIVLTAVLFLLPGVPVAYVLSVALPYDAQVLAGIAGLAVSIYACTTRWERILEAVWPDVMLRND